MKKLVALVLVALALVAFAGSASARPVGDFLSLGNGHGNGNAYGHSK